MGFGRHMACIKPKKAFENFIVVYHDSDFWTEFFIDKTLDRTINGILMDIQQSCGWIYTYWWDMASQVGNTGGEKAIPMCKLASFSSISENVHISIFSA